MKAFILPLLLIFLLSCSRRQTKESKEKFINVYTSGADSVFWGTGKEFDSTTIIRGVRNDSAFMLGFLKAISEPNGKIIFKPLAGSGGGSGEAMVNMGLYFQKNHILDVSFSEIDSAEKRYFNDISFSEYLKNIQQQAPPDPIIVQAPVSVSTKVNPDSCLLFTLTKTKVYYTDQINGNKSASQEIKLYTKNEIIRVINAIERKHQIKLSENEKFLLIKGDASLPYTSFKILKDAFKEKEIYKFRIVTTGN